MECTPFSVRATRARPSMPRTSGKRAGSVTKAWPKANSLSVPCMCRSTWARIIRWCSGFVGFIRAHVDLHMHGTDSEFAFGHAFVTLPARFPEVRGIDGRARVARTENGVHSMARSAIRRGYFPLRQGQPVIAAGIGWEAIRGQIIAQCQTGIAMTTPAGLRGDIFGIQWRAGIARVHDQVFAVAVDADGRIPHAGLDRFPVDTLVELPGDFLVALRAGLRHFPVIDLGSRIGGGIDVMTAMATGTHSRILAERDRAPVNAQLVGIHRMGHRNFVP